MSEPVAPKPRGRSVGWWFKWTVVAIVLVAVGAAAYWCRPLNATERMLIGGWERVQESGSEGERDRYHDYNQEIQWFRENRRWELTRPLIRRLRTGEEVRTRDVVQQGRWGATSNELLKAFDAQDNTWKGFWQQPERLYYRLIGRTRARYPLRFDGPDRVWINGIEFERFREDEVVTAAEEGTAP